MIKRKAEVARPSECAAVKDTAKSGAGQRRKVDKENRQNSNKRRKLDPETVQTRAKNDSDEDAIKQKAEDLDLTEKEDNDGLDDEAVAAEASDAGAAGAAASPSSGGRKGKSAKGAVKAVKKSVGKKVDVESGDAAKSQKFNPHVDGKGPSLAGSWRKQIEEDEALRESDGVKIAMWNVNGLRAVLRNPKNEDAEKFKGDLQAYLAVEKPHILCLNETKIDQSVEEQVMESLESAEVESDSVKYDVRWAHSQKKGYAGVAVLIRRDSGLNERILETRVGLGVPDHDEEGRCLTVVFPKCVLVTTYVANAGQGLIRLAYRIEKFDKDLHAYLRRLKTELNRPVLWCGDLNVAFQEIDIWNSKANSKSPGHTPEERNSFGQFLKSGEWVDVWRKQNAGVRRYSFWPARAVQSRVENLGWRLDYFVCSRELYEQVQACYIRDKVRGSDHCPVVLQIDKQALFSN